MWYLLYILRKLSGFRHTFTYSRTLPRWHTLPTFSHALSHTTTLLCPHPLSLPSYTPDLAGEHDGLSVRKGSKCTPGHRVTGSGPPLRGSMRHSLLSQWWLSLFTAAMWKACLCSPLCSWRGKSGGGRARAWVSISHHIRRVTSQKKKKMKKRFCSAYSTFPRVNPNSETTV